MDINKSRDVYSEFMAQYKIDHESCPKCGSTKHKTTLVGYVFYADSPEEYKDLNTCKCLNCGDTHTCHERVRKPQANIIEHHKDVKEKKVFEIKIDPEINDDNIEEYIQKVFKKFQRDIDTHID